VVGGNSFVDQATITGESLPVEKLPGTSVFAGTVHQSGALEVRVTRIGRDRAFGRILNAVEDAETLARSYPENRRQACRYLVWFALGCALLTFVITRNLTSTISVIIVTGACGIAPGTPLAILGGIGRSAREGAIIKGGLYLELLSSVDTVVFDKTGTLTFGNPKVTAILAADGHTEQEVLQTASIAEQRSEHPCAFMFSPVPLRPPSHYRRRPKSNRRFARKPVTTCGEKPPAQHHSVLRGDSDGNS
jgi:Cd2+/Zn2+-exporting ATPase/Cu+-exporting ATPase